MRYAVFYPRTIFSDDEVQGDQGGAGSEDFEVDFDHTFREEAQEEGIKSSTNSRIKRLVDDDNDNTRTTSVSDKIAKLLKRKGKKAHVIESGIFMLT